MHSPEPQPQFDSLPGIPAPVLTRRLFGHDAQLAFLAASHRSGRLHHALMFEGPPGVGKATAAFHLAQHLLTVPGAGGHAEKLLLLDADGPGFHQLACGTHHQVLHLSRPFDPKTEKFKTMLTVDEVRRIGHFVSRTNTGGGHRVVIIDSVDDLNAAAANALLKNLEEPPQRTVFALISHGERRVLPTIRSRCQTLRFGALNRGDLQAAALGALPEGSRLDEDVLDIADGSVRRALTLAAFGGLEVINRAGELIRAPSFDAEQAGKLGDAMNGREADIQYQLLTDHLLRRIDKAAAHEAMSGQHRAARQLSQLHNETAAMLSDAQRFNLDRKQTVFGLISALRTKIPAGPV